MSAHSPSRRPGDPPSESIARGYELRDARGLPLIGFILLILAGTAGAMALTRAILRGLESARSVRDVPRHALADERQIPPAPRLQALPAADLSEYLAAQKSLTEEYGWIDREAGIVRLPVERAMEIYLARQGVEPAGGPR